MKTHETMMDKGEGSIYSCTTFFHVVEKVAAKTPTLNTLMIQTIFQTLLLKVYKKNTSKLKATYLSAYV